MLRVFISTIIGAVLGIVLGLLVGWVLYPPTFADSTLADLAPQHSDTYTLLIAAGYVQDRDIQGAFERLQRLQVENVPAYVQDVTERYITNSRSLNEIRLLVALSSGLGRLTAPMEPFCQFCDAEASS